MEEEFTEEERKRLMLPKVPKIKWIDGIPCIELPPPKIKVHVVELKGKNPFDTLLDEIEKFMGGFFDADSEE